MNLTTKEINMLLIPTIFAVLSYLFGLMTGDTVFFYMGVFGNILQVCVIVSNMINKKS